MKNYNTYKKTSMTFEKKPVFAVYLFGDLQGYATKGTAFKLKKTKQGYKEVAAGTQWNFINRKRVDEKGNIYFLTLDQLKDEIKEEYKNWLPIAE